MYVLLMNYVRFLNHFVSYKMLFSTATVFLTVQYARQMPFNIILHVLYELYSNSLTTVLV
jgi:hypothetical protein